MASSSSWTRVWSLRGGQSEESRHEVDVVVNAELQIEVLAQTLRHVRDARAHVAPVPGVGDVAAEDDHFPLLDLLGAGDQRHERRLADAVRADDADHAARWNVEGNVVERHGFAIAVGDVLNGHHRRAGG